MMKVICVYFLKSIQEKHRGNTAGIFRKNTGLPLNIQTARLKSNQIETVKISWTVKVNQNLLVPEVKN